ncbi:MAG: hypothetical protein Kow0089_16320 [Desulfobulbaceae bacterium]
MTKNGASRGLFETARITVDPEQIGYLRFILEGYDGLATVTTIDRIAGEVLVQFPSNRRNELAGLLNALSPDLRLHRLESTPCQAL